MTELSDFQQLIRFNIDLLDQGIQVIEAVAAVPGSDYSRHIGPHLRHVIEHYEVLVKQLTSRCLDYDSRVRDRLLEGDPALARARIRSLQQQLASLDMSAAAEPITIHLRGGLAGEHNFVSLSTPARELMFVASHAVHHYAVIQMHCKAQGITLSEDFGKAPDTVRHARAA